MGAGVELVGVRGRVVDFVAGAVVVDGGAVAVAIGCSVATRAVLLAATVAVSTLFCEPSWGRARQLHPRSGEVSPSVHLFL